MSRHVLSCGLALAASLVLSAFAGAQPGPAAGNVVRGWITDSESRAPIGQAEVFVIRHGMHASTEDDGRFVLEHVPAGPCTLSVTRMGYAPLRRAITVGEGVELILELQLRRVAVRLEEITVTPGSFSFMGQGTGTRQTLSREEVQAVPQIGGDIFRAVNRLPGLASNDYSAHFGIRGGRHDETLILLDGLQLHEPYHLKDFNEGAISIVDAETIEGVQLMTGGFPARYGDRRSGVFDIASRVPEPGRTTLDLGTSMLNTRAMARGTFAGDRGAWLAFGRIGYMGPVFQFIDQADLPRPEYEDVFAKASFRLSPRHELAFDVLHAGDRYDYDITATTGFMDTIHTLERAHTDWRNSYLWATLRSTLGPRTSVRTLASGGLVRRSRDGSERDVLKSTPIYSITNDRHFATLGLAQDWTHGFSDHNLLGFGFDVRRQSNEDTYGTVVYQDPDDPEPPAPGEFPIVSNAHFEKSGTRVSLYVSDRWRAARPLVLEGGMRYDHATWTGDRDVSPRASAAWDLGRGMTVRLGWGFYRQMQGLDDVAALNGATKYFPSERSEQWTAGWDRVGAKGSVLRVEGYWKRGSRLRPVYRNWKGAIDAFPEPNEDRILVTPDRNAGRGLEVYFDRPLARTLTARASYSFAVADEDVKAMVNANSSDPLLYDRSHPNPQDQRHAANADLTWRSGRWTLNGSFAFHSGWPSTRESLVPVTNEQGQPDFAVRPEKVYGERLPDYMRVDLRATRRWTLLGGELGASLEVVNLTNHVNVFGYDSFRYRDGTGRLVFERGEETWFSIFPNAGLTWSRSF